MDSSCNVNHKEKSKKDSSKDEKYLLIVNIYQQLAKTKRSVQLQDNTGINLPLIQNRWHVK